MATRSFDVDQFGTGAVLPVVTAPNPVLSTSCQPVSPTAAKTIQLAADLVATMAVSPGCVGLAANQLGADARIFSLDVTGHPKARIVHGAVVLVNPEVVSASRKERAREGCMSVPDFTGDIRRASRLIIAGYLPGTGEPVEIETNAFEARAFLHELDHIDGLLFLDRVAGAHAIHPRQTYQ